jgi:hypothetical protein
MKNVICLKAILAIVLLGPLNVQGQITNTSHTYVGGDYVGWNTSQSLDFKIGLTTPLLMQLQTSGDLNLVSGVGPTHVNAYQIGGLSVLWHNGNDDDIFVGVGAGNGSMTGHDNTFVGHDAGTANDDGIENTFVGYDAGTVNLHGDSCTFIGWGAGASNLVGDANTFIGWGAGAANLAGQNTFLGWSAGTANDNGYGNTFLGWKAGFTESFGSENTYVGYNAGNLTSGQYHNTYVGFEAGSHGSGWDNAAVGWGALHKTNAYGGAALGISAAYNNVTGCQLVAVGEEAAYNNISGNANLAIGEVSLFHNTSHHGNIAIGFEAMKNQTTCATCNASNTFNVAVGNSALLNTNDYFTALTTTSSYNTAVGHYAGQSNKDGSNNSYFGYLSDACPTCTSLSNSAAIGANAIVMHSNEMILGDNVNVGIGLLIMQ